jgi:hypothetical protein
MGLRYGELIKRPGSGQRYATQRVQHEAGPLIMSAAAFQSSSLT